MPRPLFQFFEDVAEELSVKPSKVITRDDFRTMEEDSLPLEELMMELRITKAEDTIPCAVEKLQDHFESKGAALPFMYDQVSGRFETVDADFISFVNAMKGIRSIGRRSRDFECTVAQRLGRRATGAIHRIGHPRDRKKTRAQFNRYMKTLGFSRPVAYDKEKDGGLDILWLLPLGAIPHKPIVSVQCKNSEFDIEDADKSIGAGARSLGQNNSLQPGVHVPCVLFNDYIHPDMLTRKQFNFVPLGLTDLAPLREKILVKCI
jgi:hypothetical protein